MKLVDDMPQFQRVRALLAMVAISLLWGSGWILAPTLGETAAPFAASALIFAVAAAVSGLALPLLAGLAADQPRVAMQTSLTLALAMLAVPLTLLLIVGQHGISGWIPLLYALMPLLAGFLRDTWSPAMVVAVSAVLVLLNGAVPFTPAKMLWAAPVLAAVASQAWALGYAAKRLRRCSPAALVRTFALQAAVTAVVLAAGSFLFDPSPRLAQLSHWSLLDAGSLALLAIAGTALPYAGLYRLLAGGELAPQQVATTQWLQTLTAVVESAAFVRVRLSWQVLLAGAVLLACAWAVLRKPADSEENSLTLRGSAGTEAT